jgi:hypothetical protein
MILAPWRLKDTPRKALRGFYAQVGRATRLGRVGARVVLSGASFVSYDELGASAMLCVHLVYS